MSLGLELIKAHQTAYDYHSLKADALTSEVEHMNDQISILTHLLQAVQTQRASNCVELNTEEQRLLVDSARKIAPHAIEENTYTWHGKERIEALIESLNVEIRSISGKINTKSSHMVEAFDERKTASNELRKLLERFLRHEEEMVRKQKL